MQVHAINFPRQKRKKIKVDNEQIGFDISMEDDKSR
jgi:hypothetical protein